HIIDPASCVLPRRCSSTDTPDGIDGSSRDAGVDADAAQATTDASSPEDGGQDFTGVLCGNTICRSPKACCAGVSDLTCVDEADPCSGPKMACDGPEDCMGNGCCASGLSGCNSTPGCGPLITMCHSDKDCPSGRCTSTINGGRFKTCGN